MSLPLLFDGLGKVCDRKRGIKVKSRFLASTNGRMEFHFCIREEQIWRLGAENQQFIFEHMKFKLSIGYSVEMFTRQ